MTLDRFEELVANVVDSLPEGLLAQLDNVAFCVADDESEDCLGLYEGVARTERGGDYAGVLPDKITVYRNSILESVGNKETDIIEEIRRTLLHEIGHHLGWDDVALEAMEEKMGWKK